MGRKFFDLLVLELTDEIWLLSTFERKLSRSLIKIYLPIYCKVSPIPQTSLLKPYFLLIILSGLLYDNVPIFVLEKVSSSSNYLAIPKSESFT